MKSIDLIPGKVKKIRNTYGSLGALHNSKFG
jgi:hypothetical protein